MFYFDNDYFKIAIITTLHMLSYLYRNASTQHSLFSESFVVVNLIFIWNLEHVKISKFKSQPMETILGITNLFVKSLTKSCNLKYIKRGVVENQQQRHQQQKQHNAWYIS